MFGMLFGGLGCPHFFPDLMLVGDSVFGVLESGGGCLDGGRCGGWCRGQRAARIVLRGQQPTTHDLGSAHEVGRGHEGVAETLAHVGKQQVGVFVKALEQSGETLPVSRHDHDPLVEKVLQQWRHWVFAVWESLERYGCR